MRPPAFQTLYKTHLPPTVRFIDHHFYLECSYFKPHSIHRKATTIINLLNLFNIIRFINSTTSPPVPRPVLDPTRCLHDLGYLMQAKPLPDPRDGGAPNQPPQVFEQQSCQPWPLRQPARSPANLLRIIICLASVLISVIAAVCIRNYHSHRQYGRHHQHDKTQPHLFSYLFLNEPSPPIFVAATIIHGLATFMYFISRESDQHRERFLAIGALSAFGTGIIIGSDFQGVLLGIVPLALISALVLCTGWNVIWLYCICRDNYERDGSKCGGYDEKDYTLFEN